MYFGSMQNRSRLEKGSKWVYEHALDQISLSNNFNLTSSIFDPVIWGQVSTLFCAKLIDLRWSVLAIGFS